MFLRRSLVCVFAAAFFAVGCKPPPPTATSGTTGEAASPGDGSASVAPAAAVDLSAATPQFQVKAEDIRKEIEADLQAAAAKYGGKVVQVEGEISGADDRTAWMKGVTFAFDHPDPPLWQNLTRKSQATIKGRFATRTTRSGAPTAGLEHCVLVAHAPETRPVMTADEFAEAARHDADAFLEKYKSVEVLLTGEVAEYDIEPYKPDVIILKTSAPPRIVMQRVGLVKPRAEDQALFVAGKKVVVGVQLFARNDDLNSQIFVTFENAAWVPEAASP